MKQYSKTPQGIWSGRSSGQALYLHEKVSYIDLSDTPPTSKKAIALLGYACDEGVRRNQGRIGASGGPDAIRRMLGKLPNHLASARPLWDAGTVYCPDGNLEMAQKELADKVALLLNAGTLPIVLGGGHDMAYGHYHGILRSKRSRGKVGIVNFDAHFDLRDNTDGNNSGTPFYQLGMEARAQKSAFDYLCLGIRLDGNDRQLYETADRLGVHFIERDDFNIQELTTVQMVLLAFIEKVDGLYVTIDLDGFSSAYAPGVSSPSPMGFAPDIVWEALKIIVDSGKLVSLDVAELNPDYDTDHHTARLAAGLLHATIHRHALLQP
jgi:formiminoglutamase